MHSTLSQCFVFISLFLELYGDNNFLKRYRRGTSIFQEKNPVGLLQCVRLCFSSSNCLSFNHDRNHLMCELRSVTTGSLEQKDSYVHGKRIDFNSIYGLGCLVSDCGANSKCIFLRNGSYVCVKTECSAPVLPTFAQPLTDNSYPVAKIVEVKCVTGFLLIGEPLLICKANGQWTNGADCRGCDFPPSNINNVGSGSGSTRIGATYTYNCRTGYLLMGSPTITCQSDGTWSPVQFACV